MKLITKITFIALLAFGVSGCESLDQDSPNSLPTENAFKTVDNAMYWRNGFYKSLRDAAYYYATTFPELQSDLLNAGEDFGNRGGSFQTWTIQAGDSDISNIWQRAFIGLRNVNLCITKFPTIATTSNEERQKLNQYLGEAYAFRAYYFFQLVQYFSPQYNSSNKNTANLGVPLLLVYDVEAKPSRATLEETYTQILSDIAQAETLLSSRAGSVGANTFTIDAVKALKARVLLTKGEYAEAYSLASALVSGGKYPLATTKATLEGMFRKDEKNESILQLFVAADESSPNSDYYLSYSEKSKTYSPDYIPSQWVVDLYESTDIRKDSYLLSTTIKFPSGTYSATLVNKYPRGLYATTSSAHAPKVFRIAEQYLIAAEAAYKNGDETNAKQYLNLLRTARGVANITSTGASLFEDIKKERIRELSFEGFRLADLKRWGDAVVRRSPQSLSYIMKTPPSQFQELNVAAGDYRLTWPIPSYDILLNTNLKQNQGY
nr:RagB/SusD family nutrient uptake outer membrane protein [uncultured Capnocytophaga sp.]